MFRIVDILCGVDFTYSGIYAEVAPSNVDAGVGNPRAFCQASFRISARDRQ